MTPQARAEVRDLQPRVARWVVTAATVAAVALAAAASATLVASVRAVLSKPTVWAATPSGVTLQIQPLAEDVAEKLLAGPGARGVR